MRRTKCRRRSTPFFTFRTYATHTCLVSRKENYITIININFTNCDFELFDNSFHETTHDPEYHTVHISLTLYPLISALTGGLTLVGNVVYPTPHNTIIEMDDCRIISNYSTNYMALSTQALGALEQRMSFTQLRILCHKTVPGRTFLVATNTLLSGEHVLNYFTAKTDVFPNSCGSFYVLSKDNWIMANNCRDWGYENQQYKIRKWHHPGRNVRKRLFRSHRIYSRPSSLGCFSKSMGM